MKVARSESSRLDALMTNLTLRIILEDVVGHLEPLRKIRSPGDVVVEFVFGC